MDGKLSLPSRDQPFIPPGSGIRVSEKAGFGSRWSAVSLGAAGLLFLWVMAETLSGRICYLLPESLTVPWQSVLPHLGGSAGLKAGPGSLIVGSERWGRHILLVFRYLYFKTATSSICVLQPVLPSKVCVLLAEGGGGDSLSPRISAWYLICWTETGSQSFPILF